MRHVCPIPSARISLAGSLAASPAVTLATSLAVILALSSCATKQFSGEMDEEEKVCVVVENHHFNNVKVYAERDGVRHRLGTVDGLSTESFQIPNRVLVGSWDFRLVANPIASSETVETHGLEKIPGCHTHWHLAPNLYASRVSIR